MSAIYFIPQHQDEHCVDIVGRSPQCYVCIRGVTGPAPGN